MHKTSQLLKAVSDPNRIRIVAALSRFEELCACQITELLRISGASVSRHLSQLAQVGIVDSRKQGRWVFYQLTPESATTGLIQWIQERLVRSDTIQKDVECLDAITQIDPADICRKQRGEACCPKN